MPTLAQRRSWGLGHVEKPPVNRLLIRRQSRPLNRPTILTLATVFFIVAVVLLAGSRWHRIREFSYSKAFLNKDNPYVLHPEDHVWRDAKTLRYRWRITKSPRRPDGVLKEVYLINDAYPGPTVEARSGDRLVVEVENGLQNEGVSIHWHGLSMRDANAMDGAVGITQNSIQPGSNFTYDFNIEEHQHGTFWYHAHEQVQRGDGLFGGLVVHEPEPKHAMEDERILLVGDWYHRSAIDALEFYMHPGSFGNEPVPDSVSLNGNGRFTCGDAIPARPLDCEQRRSSKHTTLILDSTKRTPLRVVNVGSYAGIELRMDGARLTPLRVDGGHRVSGRAARRIGFLEPGERVDLIVDFVGTGALRKVPTLKVTLDTSPFKYQNPALTPTHDFPLFWQNDLHSMDVKDGGTLEFGDVQQLVAMEDQSALLPNTADLTLVLYAITQKLAHLRNEPRGFINNPSWRPQQSPAAPLISVDRDLWDKNQFVPRIGYRPDNPLWVDIVLNNLDEEAHPFHLHGYDFWVISTYSSTYNWGSYNPFEDEEAPGGPYNFATPVKKDTILVPRRGYAVLRLIADNPGIWMFHCHNVSR